MILRQNLARQGHHDCPDIVPYFYALSQNYGDPEQDYLDSYADGLLTHEAKMVYEVLLREGPMDTIRLRREAHLASKSGKSPFDRSLQRLTEAQQISLAQIEKQSGKGFCLANFL